MRWREKRWIRISINSLPLLYFVALLYLYGLTIMFHFWALFCVSPAICGDDQEVRGSRGSGVELTNVVSRPT